MAYTAPALEDGSPLEESLARVGHGQLERRHIVLGAVVVADLPPSLPTALCPLPTPHSPSLSTGESCL